jgi:hypothetical protein
MTDDYDDRYRKAMEEVGVPVVRMRSFTHDFLEVRYRLAKGGSMLLVSNSTPLALVRPLEDDEIMGPNTLVMNIETIRKSRTEFLFALHDGIPVVLGYRGKVMGFITPEIPNEYLEAFEKAWAAFASEDRKERWRDKRKRESLISGGD